MEPMVRTADGKPSRIGQAMAPVATKVVALLIGEMLADPDLATETPERVMTVGMLSAVLTGIMLGAALEAQSPVAVAQLLRESRASQDLVAQLAKAILASELVSTAPTN
jgi:transketolase C-terminal domain/subunit